jgi:formylglycine-generating enzyme required for sulfatase activity
MKKDYRVHVWENGDRYEGEWKDGQREGQGVMVFANGDRYEGEWKGDEMEGQGIYIFASGNRYQGQVKAGRQDGYGVFINVSGSRYEGEWKDDKKSGQGIMKVADGSIYNGEWKENRREGRGVMVFANGDRYEGEWKDDKREGQGIYVFTNGDRYEGEWKADMREGQGVFIDMEGDRYEGEWEAGLQEGRGVAVLGGDTYEGEWSRGFQEGYGLWTGVSGARYEGEWWRGFPEGQGVWNYADGARYEGVLKAGYPEGQGVFVWANGDRYEGEWEDGVRKGQGIYVFANGDRYEGEWEQGMLKGCEVQNWADGLHSFGTSGTVSMNDDSNSDDSVDRCERQNAGDTMKNNIGMEFSWIPSGSFMMGSPSSEAGRYQDEGPQRLVTIDRGFWMGKYEVTQEQYESLMGTNPSYFTGGGKDCPVDTVSWNDAKEFILRLNTRNDGFVYSLPSEAEWEYAARAGTTTAFAFGDSMNSTQANFDGNNVPYGSAPNGPSLGKTTRVGSYKPNAWGLYDMHGNVSEWVEDIYQDSSAELPTDGSPNTTRGDSSRRVSRGGNWSSAVSAIRSAKRISHTPKLRLTLNRYGFRVVARAR